MLVHLDLDEGEIPDAHQQRPLGSEIVDRNPDIVEPKLPRNIRHQFQVSHDLLAVDLDDQSFKGRVLGQLGPDFSEQVRVLKRADRQIDRDLDVAVLMNEIAPISHGLADDELRQRAEVRITVVQNEKSRRDGPPCRMPHAHERLGAAEAERVGVDLRLVP